MPDSWEWGQLTRSHYKNHGETEKGDIDALASFLTIQSPAGPSYWSNPTEKGELNRAEDGLGGGRQIRNSQSNP